MDDEDSELPIPELLPVPMSISIDGMAGSSAGRATGRAPPIVPRVLLLEREREAGFDAGFRLAMLVLRPRVALFGVLRLAVAFFLPPERAAVDRLAVVRLAVVRLAVDFLAVDRLPPVDRLAVDFFVDFFFAAICPPFACAIDARAW